MEVFTKISDIKAFLSKIKETGRTIGFIPTMGALHKGHLSLVNQGIKECDYSVVSIFVNPTQFNDKNDYEKYPRDVEKDIRLLEEIGCDIIFTPTVQEIYPEGKVLDYDLGGLDKVMEGKFRPGHFQGVAQIVHRLFDIITPNKAYFGEKDFQQLSIISHLVKSLALEIEIVPCPIHREGNGLAMSSRNERLTEERREKASIIYKTLLEVKDKAKVESLSDIYNMVEETFEGNELFSLEYFEIVESATLIPLNEFRTGVNLVACIAVFAGDVRLIDNVQFNL